jgi:hypothetical protein
MAAMWALGLKTWTRKHNFSTFQVHITTTSWQWILKHLIYDTNYLVLGPLDLEHLKITSTVLPVLNHASTVVYLNMTRLRPCKRQGSGTYRTYLIHNTWQGNGVFCTGQLNLSCTWTVRWFLLCTKEGNDTFQMTEQWSPVTGTTKHLYLTYRYMTGMWCYRVHDQALVPSLYMTGLWYLAFT